MRRLPLAIGIASFSTVLAGLIAFALDSGPFDNSSAAMISLSIAGIGIGGLAGLLLVRSRWSRWVLGVAIALSMLAASIGDSPLFWLTLALGAVSIVGLTGPWLTLWVRQQPVADPLGPIPVTLLASPALTPLLVGVSASEGATVRNWILVGVVLVSGWAYGRGFRVGIWSFRVAVPVAGLVAVLDTAVPGSVLLLTGVAALTAISWMPHARRVTAVITPPLPAPRPRKESDSAEL